MGDEQLTNGKLQVYYWNVVQSILSSNYGYSLMYQGLLDYSQPLDTQLCSEDSSLTWQQFFLGEALNYWQMYQSLALEAKNAGMEMPAEDREYLDGLEASLEETAANYGLSGIEELLLKNVGPGAGLEEFAGFQELYYQGKPYYTAETEKLVPTPEDLEAYYTENESYFTGNGVTKDGTYVSVRHILVMPEGGTTGDDGTTTYSDEEWAACEKKAQEILDEWLAGYTMNIKTATRSAYEEHIRVHIKPSLGNARCFTYSLILKLHFWDSTVILFSSWSVTQNAIRFSFFINQLLVFSLPGDWGSPQRWGTCGTQVPCLLHYRTASALHR